MTVGEHGRPTDRGELGTAPEGPRPGESWIAWLEGEAARYENHLDAAGRVVGAALRRLAGHARELGASSPEDYERLAEEAVDSDAAWEAAREAEWDAFLGRWTLGPDADDRTEPVPGRDVG